MDTLQTRANINLPGDIKNVVRMIAKAEDRKMTTVIQRALRVYVIGRPALEALLTDNQLQSIRHTLKI